MRRRSFIRGLFRTVLGGYAASQLKGVEVLDELTAPPSYITDPDMWYITNPDVIWRWRPYSLGFKVSEEALADDLYRSWAGHHEDWNPDAL